MVTFPSRESRLPWSERAELRRALFTVSPCFLEDCGRLFAVKGLLSWLSFTLIELTRFLIISGETTGFWPELTAIVLCEEPV